MNSQAVRHKSEAIITGIEDIKFILSSISFAPSCVDMGWEWEVTEVLQPDYSRLQGEEDPLFGYMLRTTFRRPERNTGDIAIGYGRWWFVPHDVTLSGVVKTAYKAAMLILEHELMESFKWQGKRVFDPHNSVEALASLSNDTPEPTVGFGAGTISVKRRVKMSLIDWGKLIGLSAVTISFVLCVLYGVWQLLIVTAHAIVK